MSDRLTDPTTGKDIKTETQPQDGNLVRATSPQHAFAEALATHVQKHNDDAEDAPSYVGPSIDVHFQNFTERPTPMGDPKANKDTDAKIAGPLPVPSEDDLGDVIFWLGKQFERAAGHPCKITHIVTSGSGTTRLVLRSV